MATRILTAASAAPARIALNAWIDLVWIDATRHREAERVLLGLHRRSVNIVDAASFAVMRELGIATAFAFDADFEHEGFRVIGPGPE